MTDLSKRIAALSPEMRKLLLQQLKQEESGKPSLEAIPLLSRETKAFPLSFSQERLWLLDQLEPGNPAYNIAGAIRLTGHLNSAALEQSLTEIVRRHEALRTSFSMVGEQPMQVIHPSMPVQIPLVHIRPSAAGSAEAAVKKMISVEALYRFDLRQGPLFRTTLYKLSETDHIFFIVIHHIVSDGWSLNVLVREVSALYHAYERELPSPLPELTVQYVDYAAWQRTSLQGVKLEQQLSYWKQQLGGNLPVLALPVDHPRPTMRTFHGATLAVQLSPSLTAKLKALSQFEGKTLFVTLLAAFKVLLHRYSGQDDLIVGSPIANRNRLEIEGLIGYFINMLALRTDLSDNPSFREFLNQVHQVTLAAYENQDIPIDKLMEQLHPTRILDHNPLFQVAFIFQNFSPVEMKLGDLMISPLDVENEVATLDVSLYMKEQDHGLAGIVEYNRDIFDEGTIRRMFTHYQALLESIVANPDQKILDLPFILNTQDIEASLPLSPMQEGMLFQTLRSPESGAYIEQMVIDLNEEVNVPAFLESWEQVISRHPVLRTGFEWLGNEQPLQLVYKQAQIALDQQDWRGVSAQEQENRFQKYLAQDREHGFEITEPPLMRLALLHMTETHDRCLWTFHHAILDGRSFTIILKELFSIYEARCENKSWSAAVPRPYQEFIQWLQQNSLEDAKTFWQRSLQGFSDPNSLSFGFPDVDRQGYGEQKTRLSVAITKTLQTLAGAHELTLNTILQGAWAILLSHYTGENEIVFGTTRAGRHFPMEGAESMVGLFINTLPLHVKLSPEMKLLDLLRSIREQSIASRPYEHTPLHKIQEWSDVPRGSVLFETILVFENYLLNTSLQNQGGKWTGRKFRLLEQTGFPLTLSGYADSELLLNIEYELARFDDRTMTGLLSHLQDMLIFMAIEGLRGTLSDIPLVGPEEKRQLLIEWNSAHSEHSLNGCIHELFESQVQRTPDAIAVSSENGQLTYQELNQRANQLARFLHRLGAGPETIVGICMERSVEMVVGLLGILKAGAAYLPFDPSHPQDRLLHALQDSQSPVLMTQQNLLSNLPGYEGQLVYLESDWPAIAREEASNPSYDMQDYNLAYVIYTSGSTGKPKGVMVEHRALVRFVEAATGVYEIGHRDRMLQFASISFDASAEEIYTTLTRGATLVLRNDDMLTSAGNFLRKCEEWDITVVDLPTAFWHQLTGELNRADAKFPQTLRLTIIGGEKAQASSVTEWFRHAPHSIRLVNTYGPTEATVVATVYEFSADLVLSHALIGRPLENAEAFILDQYLQPVPVGVGGELFIGGESLARGYLHQEQLTAEKFIADPFSNKPGARLYKTGDRARYLPDGNIEFLGRLDQQVKIRGFRIELGEIEAVLGRHPAIQENVVIAHEEQPGDKYLVAYFVPDPNTPFNISELRTFLRKTLPDYMVPAVFVELEHLPLTPSGKVNRRALPVPDRSRSSSERQFVAPRDEVETSIATIMANVLNLNQVGVYDNFFDLGGHSLLATRVLSRVNEKFAVRLSLKNFFVSPTVVGLSEVVKTILWATQDRSTISGMADGEREEIEL